ncbi:MAG: phytanoyl-CoA dioxygenase family protein [Pseudomonadota bacterium]
MSNSPILLTDDEVRQFIVDGFIALEPDVDPTVHANINRQLRTAAAREPHHGNNILPRIPELYTVLESSRIHGAVTSLLGPDYLLHPHRAIHRSTPVDDLTIDTDIEADGLPMGKGSTAASVWHQDAQSPLARARHHTPRFLIGFYFPHDTPLKMGPTRLQASSYLWPGPQDEPIDVVVPDYVKAGTFVLVHFDMVHAGLSNRSDSDRYMLKFVFNRMSNPTAPTWNSKVEQWRLPERVGLRAFDDAWENIWRWLHGGERKPVNVGKVNNLRNKDIELSVNAIYQSYAPEWLSRSLLDKAGRDLHIRRLVRTSNGRQLVRDDISGYPRRWNERAVVVEPESHAFALLGSDAIPYLLELAELEDPWLDINIAFTLGEIGIMNDDVECLITRMLASAIQQVVRQAIDAIAFIQPNATPFLDQFLDLLSSERPEWQRKEVERGWVAQDQIRLNIMFACVALLNTKTDKTQLETLFKTGLDDQGYCAAVALEGLRRLGDPSALAIALDYACKRNWDLGLLNREVGY